MSGFVYSVAEIRAIESAHEKQHPKDALMLLAGTAVAALAATLVNKKRGANILVLAGPGNNGDCVRATGTPTAAYARPIRSPTQGVLCRTRSPRTPHPRTQQSPQRYESVAHQAG